MTFSSVVERIFGRKVQREQDTGAALRELARLEAEGKADAGTVAKLEASLGAREVSREEFARQVALHKRRAQLKAEAARVPALRAAAEKAAANLREAETEAEEQARRAREAVRVAALHFQRADAELTIGQRSACWLSELEYAEADRLGLVRPDLDACALRSGGNVYPHGDPDAPVVDIPAHLYDQEAARRRELVGKLQARALAEWESAWAVYDKAINKPGDPPILNSEALEAEWPKVVSRRAAAAGLTRPAKDAPRIAWADVVRAGMNR